MGAIREREDISIDKKARGSSQKLEMDLGTVFTASLYNSDQIISFMLKHLP